MNGNDTQRFTVDLVTTCTAGHDSVPDVYKPSTVVYNRVNNGTNECLPKSRTSTPHAVCGKNA